jgi:beta-phosphoglucomutase-like phosphatase (HAD superfamily)
MLTATVFDLDGTLIDSGAAWISTCAAYTAAHGYKWTTADSAALRGNGDWSSHVAALCGGVPASRVARDCSHAMVGALAGGHIRMLPGAARLSIEAGRYGPLALISASPRRFVQAVITHFGLTGRFAAVVCAEDARPKPAPDPYLRAATALGTDPRDCVAVAESPHGIRAAYAADMTVLAIPRAGDPLTADVRTLALLRAGNAVEATALLPLLYGRFDPPRPRAALVTPARA